jgi:hypothetical protein
VSLSLILYTVTLLISLRYHLAAHFYMLPEC